MAERMVVYTGGNYRLKRGLCPKEFNVNVMKKGEKVCKITFKTGVVYRVSEQLFEYLKGVRGFFEIKGVSKDFKKYPSEKNDQNTMGKRQSGASNGVRTGNKKPSKQVQKG